MGFDQYVFFRNYKWRQLIIVFLSLALLSWGILYVSSLLSAVLPDYIVKAPEPIRVVGFFSLLVVLFILLETLWKEALNLHKRDKIYKFRLRDWPDKWVFNGKTEPTSDPAGLHIKSSRAGSLLKNYLWKNFRMSLEMKFPGHPMNFVGIVFRALDLDNYFMLEIIQKSPFENNKSGIKPHVRYQGAWEIMDLTEKSFLDFSDFVKVTLEAIDNTIHLYFKDNLIFEWILPTHVDVNHIESGFKQGAKPETVGREISKSVREIPFRLDYGMVGFRAHPGQGAIIKGLKIEPF